MKELGCRDSAVGFPFPVAMLQLHTHLDSRGCACVCVFDCCWLWHYTWHLRHRTAVEAQLSDGGVPPSTLDPSIPHPVSFILWPPCHSPAPLLSCWCWPPFWRRTPGRMLTIPQREELLLKAAISRAAVCVRVCESLQTASLHQAPTFNQSPLSLAGEQQPPLSFAAKWHIFMSLNGFSVQVDNFSGSLLSFCMCCAFNQFNAEISQAYLLKDCYLSRSPFI